MNPLFLGEESRTRGSVEIEPMKNSDNLGYELIGLPKSDITVNQSFREEICSIDCFLYNDIHCCYLLKIGTSEVDLYKDIY